MNYSTFELASIERNKKLTGPLFACSKILSLISNKDSSSVMPEYSLFRIIAFSKTKQSSKKLFSPLYPLFVLALSLKYFAKNFLKISGSFSFGKFLGARWCAQKIIFGFRSSIFFLVTSFACLLSVLGGEIKII